MKYSIESTESGCVETITFNGVTYTKRHTKTDYGSRCKDDEFYEQMENDGVCEEVLDKVCNTFDSFIASDFMDIAKWERNEG